MRLLGAAYVVLWITFMWIVTHPAQPRTIPAPLWYDALNLALQIGWFVVGCMVGFRLVAGERAGAWALILVANIVGGMLLVAVVESVPGAPQWSPEQSMVSVIIFAALVGVPMLVLFVERR